jgi:hypothetical protein
MMLAPLADACDVMIVVYRDPVATMKSQQAEGLSRYEAEAKLRSGYYEIACAIRLVSVPVYCLTYEQLVLDPDSIRPLLALLNLDADADIEEVINENVKYREYQ